MDLSRFSTADLQAMKSGDLTRVSTNGLRMMKEMQQAAEVNPTAGMSGLDTLRAGIGRGMASAARGVGNLVGLVSDEDVAEAKRLDKALLDTTGGKVGNVVGSAAVAAPTALIPGANTYLGAGLIGSAFGGLTTEGDLLERLRGALFGGAGGLAGKAVGDALGAGARALADRGKTAAQLPAGAKTAADAGYVIPPADLRPGMLTEALSGYSGKIKTAQVASQQNQGVTNELAAKALGLPAGEQITPKALAGLRDAAAARGYTPVRQAGDIQADAIYEKALDKIAGQYQGAARSFPGMVKNPVLEMVDGLRGAKKFDAGDALDMVKVLRESADQAYTSGNKALGKASKAAADALEEQIDRALTANGSPEAIKAFREARKEIAKTYSVQRTLNQTTGDVSSAKMAKQLEKGAPLSDELLTIAQVGQAFPKATQTLKEAPKAWSPLDWMTGGAGVGFGSPTLSLLAAGRPLARSALLSGPYQRAAMSEAPSLLSQAPAMLLDQQLTRQMAPGLFAGMLTAN